MKTIVCTLLESHFHFGAASLFNSLHFHGFRGDLFIGYRGELPVWTKSLDEFPSDIVCENNIKAYNCKGCVLYFIEININRHLAHYKPQFILNLMNEISPNADSIAYFDPDITIKCRWTFFEKWLSYGVAVVHEIVMQDMPANHPTRLEWKSFLFELNYAVNNDINSYLNCGFCAISRDNIGFIEIWENLILSSIDKYSLDPYVFSNHDRTSIFWSIDQDTFNMAAMAHEYSLSEMGPEAMDFLPGGWVMSHSVGSPKPWKKSFIFSALKGISVSMQEKEYWKYSNGIIKPFSSFYIKRKKIAILVSNFISRFYNRN